MKEENFYLTTTPIKKLLLKFSIPCILSMLVSALYNIVDQIFIGNSTAGTAGIMATTLAFPLTVVALAIALLIGDGSAALFSISMGSKDKNISKKCMGNAIILVTLFSIILTIVSFLFMDPILELLGLSGYDARCQLFTKQYLTIILCGLPFYMITSATSSMIRSDGSPGYSMIATITGAIINLILDPVLIFGFDMGIQGAAIATIAGQIISSILSIIYFRKPKLIPVEKESFQLDSKVCKKLLQLGISSFITQVSIAVITIVANNVVGSIGGIHATDAGGALGIVFKIFAIILAFSVGVAVGGQPIIGYNYGAKQYKRVLETYKYIIIVNIIIGMIGTILFEFTPNLLLGIFGGHANDLEFYQDYAVLSFRIYLGGILFCCIQKASCIFLQSIDKPYKAMFLSLMRDVILLVPGVCLLGFYGNLHTMLWAGPIADIGSFIVTVILVSLELSKMKVLIHNQPTKEEVSKIENTNFCISIGREFGSGGKYIGQELAKLLQIKCYDNELLKQVSKNYQIDMNTLKKQDEKQKSSFWYSFATNYVFSKDKEISPISAEDSLFLKQARVMEEITEKENCIIIGRCSDYILKNKPNLIKIFIYSSDENFKINRKKELEHISKKDAKIKIKKIDKERSEYYKHFTGQIWGDKKNYDICIDTSIIGVENTITILKKYIETRIHYK